MVQHSFKQKKYNVNEVHTDVCARFKYSTVQVNDT